VVSQVNLQCMDARVKSPAKDMRVFERIAKAAILQDLCQEGMGVSVKYRTFHTLI